MAVDDGLAGDKRRVAFLEGLEQGLSAAGAAEAAGIARSLVYRWRDRDRAFAVAWQLAAEAGTDRLEDEAMRRALEGVEKPVFWRGAEVGTVRTYNDRLLMLLLQRRRPLREPHAEERYFDSQETNVFINDLFEALRQCDRRIAELTQEVAALRRGAAGAVPDGEAPPPAPVAVALPYDKDALFGEDTDAAFEELEAAGIDTGPSGAEDDTPGAPEVDSDIACRLSVSRCPPAERRYRFKTMRWHLADKAAYKPAWAALRPRPAANHDKDHLP